ncbi:putative amidohydrolase YtcJ [Novosphingobium sp. 1529]|uniref:amidohydrolase family protein n=1 Tax=Novosphingobium sp. 1529 TaxID=3156424 RepID=UPI0033997B76
MDVRAETKTAYINGRIYTGVQRERWVDAMLVCDGLIAATGKTPDILQQAGAVPVVDLQGRMVMAGLHDAHIHLLASGLKFQHECRITPNAGPEQIVQELCNCPKCRTPALSDWIIAGEINPNIFPAGTLDRAFLDEAFPDKAVFLFDYTIHHALVNSKALALAGIDAQSQDPRGGRIIRRPGSSEPTGELVERATWPVHRVIPAYDDSIYSDALIWAMETSSRFGITSVQEASATLAQLRILNQLDAAGKMPMRVARQTG